MKTSRLCSISQHNLGTTLRNTRRLILVPILTVATLLPGAVSLGQIFGNNQGNRVVGGIRIDAGGMVGNVSIADQNAEVVRLREQIKGGGQAFADACKMRMISLKAVQAAMVEAAKTGKPLPEEIALMGGLTRIEYVFAYPESKDIVVAGPSEDWTVGKNGAIVGMESNRPIVYLEDFVAAFRAMMPESQRVISCSIDPTPEGTKQLTKLLDGVKLGPNTNPVSYEAAMKQAFGPQVVALTGVDTTSHLARVLLAADYQMKRYGMNLAKAPVKGLPSYIELIKNKSIKSPQNRWWMACDYKPIEQTEDGLSWKIAGPGIKTMTEQEVIQDDGTVKQAGKTESNAERWAELFTEKMSELSTKEPVFGQLRNIMDASVASAVIHSRNLADVSGCDLSVLLGKKATLALTELEAPKTLEPQCSFLKTAGGWVVTASGGVLIDGWKIAGQAVTNTELVSLRKSAKPSSSDGWSWK